MSKIKFNPKFAQVNILKLTILPNVNNRLFISTNVLPKQLKKLYLNNQ